MQPFKQTAGLSIWLLFVTWATVEASVSLWSFCHDAARRDFGHFVQSARLWRISGNLYESLPRVNLNPPHASVILFTPLTWISFESAVWLWAVLQVGALAIAILLISRELHLTAQRLEWIVPAIIASAMTQHNWIEGQLGGLLLIGGVIAWRAARHHAGGVASITLASLVSLKPQLAFLLPASTLRTGIRAILIAAAFMMAGVVFLGLPLWKAWFAISRVNGLQLTPWNVSIAPLLFRSGVTDHLLYLYVPSAVLIAVITCLATWRDVDGDRVWLLWGISMLLIGPVAWVYYAAVFLGPLISWGERHGWPLGAKVAIISWLIPLRTVSWVASSLSPYTLGAIILWLSVLSNRRLPTSPCDT